MPLQWCSEPAHSGGSLASQRGPTHPGNCQHRCTRSNASVKRSKARSPPPEKHLLWVCDLIVSSRQNGTVNAGIKGACHHPSTNIFERGGGQKQQKAWGRNGWDHDTILLCLVELHGVGCREGCAPLSFSFFLQRWFSNQDLIHFRQCWEWMMNYLTEVTTLTLKAGSKTTVSSGSEGSGARLLRPPPNAWDRGAQAHGPPPIINSSNSTKYNSR